jgi:hypothetical protein
MHVLAGALGALLIVLVLAEFFVTFLLPRRVKREPRIARQIYALLWRPWRSLAARLSPRGADTLLGFFGPAGVVVELFLWAVGIVLGFALLQWATGSHLRPGHSVGFGDDLYFSAGGFLSASTDLTPRTTTERFLFIWEAATALGVLFIVIGYLPALYQSFSRREVAVSQLDPQAGSPPSAGALLARSARRRSFDELVSYLEHWEEWAAELMETHLSYPLLGFFRSQHVNQNWLAALTTILDTCSFLIAASPAEPPDPARLTFAIGRHAVADLAYAYRATPRAPAEPRLTMEGLAELRAICAQVDLEMPDQDAMYERLERLRALYEPYVVAISDALALPLPSWLASEETEKNWRAAGWVTRSRTTALP